MFPFRMCVNVLSGRASAACGAVVLASVVSAQEVPVPALPPASPPDAGPTTPAEEPPATEGSAPLPASARWHYGLGVGVYYDGNVAFRVGEGPSSWAISPRGNIARVFTRPRGEVTLFARGSWHGYRQTSALNRYDASVGLSGSYRPSLNTTWFANASYDLGYSDTSPTLSDQGVLLPLVRTKTMDGRVGWNRSVARRTSLRLYGWFSRVEFDNQDPAGRALADGQQVRGAAALQREVGAGDSVAIQYSIGTTLARQPPAFVDGGRTYYITHYGSLRWNHVLGRRSAFLLEGGASYTPEKKEAGLERRVSFHGGVSYTRQVEGANLMLFARREVTPAFGLGVSRIQTRFGIIATRPLGRAWTFDISAAHSLLETPEEATFRYGTPTEVLARLLRRLGRHFAVSCEGHYRHRGSGGALPAAESYQVGLFLSLNGP